MKGIISNINKAFENRIRLGVMSVLMVNDWVDFNTLKVSHSSYKHNRFSTFQSAHVLVQSFSTGVSWWDRRCVAGNWCVTGGSR